MKSKTIKAVALCLAAALTAGSAMAGCQSSSPASPAASGSTGSKLSGKLTIWSWGAGDEKTAREQAVNVFKKEHPELQITHIVLPTANSVWDQKSAAAYAAGNAGDVMQMSPDYYGLNDKYYEDLTPYIKKENVKTDDVFVKGTFDSYKSPTGKLDGMPLVANCFIFAYNKSLFDKAGVSYPTDNWTWDDLAQMAPKFVSGSGANETYCLADHWVLPNFAIISKGGSPYPKDFSKCLLGSKEVADGLDLFGAMVKGKSMPNDVQSKNLPAEQLFVSGKAAIYPMGGFEIAQVSKEIGSSFKWDAVLPPKGSSSGTNTNITYATGYAMNIASKNKDAAWQFMKEDAYANSDMAKETAKSGMPANKSVADSDFSKQTYGSVSTSKYVTAMETSRLNPFGGAFATVGDQWTQMWQYATVSGKTGAETQQKYMPAVEDAYKKLNLKA